MTDPIRSVTRLAAALVALQKELPHIGKAQTAKVRTEKGPDYSYDYADLTDITDQLMPLLGGYGLAFMAKPTLRADEKGAVRFVLAYSLLHESGEREDGEYPLPLQGTPQAIGSAITYGRRYCLCAVTGVAPGGSDDDGAAASRQQRQGADVEDVSPQPDPEVEALRTAWTYAVGTWRAAHDWAAFTDASRAALIADFEQYAAVPLRDATADQLNAYADHLAAAHKAEAATETKPEEAKPDADGE